eukprot:gene7252-7465_t
MGWASGLVVTTTGMQQQEKELVKEAVEAGGGRYSPNLSTKRTTHLVTHPTVSNMSEKLAAVVADKQQPQQTQQRYATVRLVNLKWIETSCHAGTKADEADFVPHITSEQVHHPTSSQLHPGLNIIQDNQAATRHF